MKKQVSLLFVLALMLSVSAFAQTSIFTASVGVAPASPASATPGATVPLTVTGWQYVYKDAFKWDGTTWVSAGTLQGPAPAAGGWLAVPSGSSATLNYAAGSTAGDTTIAVFACNKINDLLYNCNGDVVLNSALQVTANNAKWMLHHVLVSGTGGTCTPNWQCTTYSACAGGTQTRTCTDANACGVTTSKPPESQSCSTSTTSAVTLVTNSRLYVPGVVGTGTPFSCDSAQGSDFLTCKSTFSGSSGSQYDISGDLTPATTQWTLVDARVVKDGTDAQPNGFLEKQDCTGTTCLLRTSALPVTGTYNYEVRAKASAGTVVPAGTVPVVSLASQLTPDHFSTLTWPSTTVVPSAASITHDVSAKNLGGQEWSSPRYSLQVRIKYDSNVFVHSVAFPAGITTRQGETVDFSFPINRQAAAPGTLVTIEFQMAKDGTPFGDTTSVRWTMG